MHDQRADLQTLYDHMTFDVSQVYLRDVDALAQQVDSHQHVQVAALQHPQKVRSLRGVQRGVEVLGAYVSEAKQHETHTHK